jgi:hypothetical protein
MDGVIMDKVRAFDVPVDNMERAKRFLAGRLNEFQGVVVISMQFRQCQLIRMENQKFMEESMEDCFREELMG